MAPDIEVDNRPDLVMAGHDPQLEKAIEVVMKEIQEHPRNCLRGPLICPHTQPGQVNRKERTAFAQIRQRKGTRTSRSSAAFGN